MESRNVYSHTETRPLAIVYDFDGTLIDIRSSLHLLEVEKECGFYNKDHSLFTPATDWAPPLPLFDQEVMTSSPYSAFHRIILTSRKERWRGLTKRWLERNGLKRGLIERIYMRGDFDERSDVEFKAEAIKELSEDYFIWRIYEDNPDVIRMYRMLGYRVTDANEFNEVGSTYPIKSNSKDVKEEGE